MFFPPTRRHFAAAFALAGAILTHAQTPAKLDFDNGNSAAEVVVPLAIPAIYRHISPGAMDPPTILRVTALTTNGWFDAIAPYHPTAVGVYSRIPRRPAAERTNRNKNTAILHASYRILSFVIPQNAAGWREMMTVNGLNPDDAQENNTTPVGIGNLAAKAIIAARSNDGMNQLGNEGGRRFNLQPYSDYTGYQPVNTAYVLRNPSRWQPNLIPFTGGQAGQFHVQQFITPQFGFTKPYSYSDPRQFTVPPPRKSNHNNREAYRLQADEVLSASARLSDQQKMTSELFDNKFNSLFATVGFLAQARRLDLDGFVQIEFLTNMVAFDAGIAVWYQKYIYDAVRPFSAIRYVYGNRTVTAWGGPGRGTVNNIPASEWRSYLGTANHPEYPSGSAGLCAAHAQSVRRLFNTDALGWSVPVAKGVFDCGTWCDAGNGSCTWTLQHMVGFRTRVRSEPPLGWRSLSGCDRRRRSTR